MTLLTGEENTRCGIAQQFHPDGENLHPSPKQSVTVSERPGLDRLSYAKKKRKRERPKRPDVLIFQHIFQLQSIVTFEPVNLNGMRPLLKGSPAEIFQGGEESAGKANWSSLLPGWS